VYLYSYYYLFLERSVIAACATLRTVLPLNTNALLALASFARKLITGMSYMRKRGAVYPFGQSPRFGMPHK